MSLININLYCKKINESWYMLSCVDHGHQIGMGRLDWIESRRSDLHCVEATKYEDQREREGDGNSSM